MKIVQLDPSDRRQRRDFLELPRRIYRDIPQWVPPIAGEERSRLDAIHNPYFKHSEAAFFIAYQDEDPVGRIAVLDNRLYNLHNNEKTAFFYLFESVPDPEPSRLLFNAAFTWASSHNLDKMVGPKGFTALDGLGLLVKGFEHRPALGLPYNPAYYPSLIEACGFEKQNDIVSGYLSADLNFPQRIHDLASRLQERRGLRIARFKTRAQLRQALSHLMELYNGVLQGTSGGTPITKAEISALANQMLWFADPNLIKIVMKGDQPVGFLLAYPDISAALQKTGGRLLPTGWITMLRASHTTELININGAGMIEEYRGLGGTAILYSEMFKSVSSNRRYRHAEVVQIGVENERMQREMENFGVDFYKTHRVYQKMIREIL